MDQAALLSKISASNRADVEHLISFLNFEIEYILRPRSAPIRYKPPFTPRHRGAQSAKRKPPAGYPSVPAGRAKSLERHRMEGQTPPAIRLDAGGKRIRNIEIPDKEFSSSSGRPSTAPVSRSGVSPRRRSRPRSSRRPRSPSHPNYKEENYLLTQVRMQYVGSPKWEEEASPGSRSRSRSRGRRRRRNRSSGSSGQLDEVTIVQQPSGSYVLEVFHGFLAVGGEIFIYCSWDRKSFFMFSHFICRRISVYVPPGRRLSLQSDRLREPAVSRQTVDVLRSPQDRGRPHRAGLLSTVGALRRIALHQVTVVYYFCHPHFLALRWL